MTSYGLFSKVRAGAAEGSLRLLKDTVSHILYSTISGEKSADVAGKGADFRIFSISSWMCASSG